MLDLGASQADGSLLFTCDIEAKLQDAEVDFSGAYVQGAKGSRFLYLSWANGDCGWRQRIKISLMTITPQQVRGGNPIEAIIENGCASGTVKPKTGWKTV